MIAKIHRSKVGTYHPAPCECEKFTGCAHARTESMRSDDADWPYRKCLDCGHTLLRGCVICSCNNVAWTINDTRGYLDVGPACDECGACECPPTHAGSKVGAHECDCDYCEQLECIGLSFAFVCLDGGEALCEECARKAGVVVVPCDCGE